jgi:hypothetical protein
VLPPAVKVNTQAPPPPQQAPTSVTLSL